MLTTEKIVRFERVPSWTVTRGPAAGKNFPVSTKAVETVRLNVQKLAERLARFNAKFGYAKTVTPMPEVEKDWPRPL